MALVELVRLPSGAEAELLRARRAGEIKLFSMTTGLMHLAFLQILIGALVAGIDAGRQYTGWPTMGGEWVPAAIWDAALGWRNFFENPALVQFIHRAVGYLLARATDTVADAVDMDCRERLALLRMMGETVASHL